VAWLLLCSPYILRAGTISNFDQASPGDNTWSNPLNWDNGVPSGTSYTAAIGISYGRQSAYLDTPEIIGGLSVGGTSSLGFASASSLTLGDGGTVGTLNNAGTVTLNYDTLTLNSSAGTTGNFYTSTNSGTLDLYHGTLLLNDGGHGVGTSLTGNGRIALDYGTIKGQFGDERLAVQGTIQGTGTISNLTLAPISGQTLTLDESGGGLLTVGPNTMIATNGGSLVLLGSNLNLSVDNQGAINVGAGDTFTFKGDGTAFGQFSLGNDGAINITNGILKLDSNGGASSAFLIGGVSSTGTLTLSGGTITGTTGTTYFSNYTGSTLQGNGTIAANLSFANVGNVVANGGTLILGNSLDYNTGTHTLSTSNDLGTYTANNGAILQFGNMAAGTGITANASNIVLNGTGEFENAAGRNALAGFLKTNSGSLTLQNGATLSLTRSFTNSGELNVLTGSTLDLTHGGFANVDAAGSLHGGTYTIGGMVVYNGGDITAIGSTANLTLDGSGLIQNANGGDHNALTGSLATNNGTLTLGNGATLSLMQAFTNDGDLNVLAGSKLDLTAGGFANVTAGGALNGGTYNIGGTLVYNGADITAIGSTANLTLNGASGIVMNTSGGDHDALTGSLATNNGTLTLENGATLSLTLAFTNNGALNAMAGSTLDLTSGGFANVSATGALNGGTYAIGGEILYAGHDVTSIGSTAGLTVDGSGAIVNATGGDHNALTGSLTTNSGTLTVGGGADLTLTQVFTNKGTLNVLANSTLDLTGGGFGNVSGSGVLRGGTYTIGGTLNYSGSDIRTIGYATRLTLNGSGVIVNTTGSNPDALSNSLTTNYGKFTLQNGAYLALGQTFTNHGTLNIQASSTLDLTGGGFGNVNGSGLLNGGDYKIAGSLYYYGSDIVMLGAHTSLTLNGSGTIFNYATDNSVSETLATNNGKLTLLNGANVEPAGTFTNNGSVNVLSGSGLVADSITNSGRMTVAGSFLVSGLRIWSAVEAGNGFANSGDVLIENGTSLTVDSGNYTQTSGFTEVNGTLNVTEADLQGGTLDGTGTIDGTLLNEGGTVTPGDAPGVLTVTNFTQTSGDVLFNIEGTLPGMDYSQLLVTNAATFGGDIEFDFAGFTPQSNQVYTVIESGLASSGEFAGYTIDGLPAGYAADISYNVLDSNGDYDVDVSFVAATPEPASMALMLAGLVLIGLAGRRRAQDRSAQDRIEVRIL
jgi:hypothetical protein